MYRLNLVRQSVCSSKSKRLQGCRSLLPMYNHSCHGICPPSASTGFTYICEPSYSRFPIVSAPSPLETMSIRLTDTFTPSLKSFLGDVPPYAMLSHMWGDKEISFQDMLAIRNERTTRRPRNPGTLKSWRLVSWELNMHGLMRAASTRQAVPS